MISLTHAFEAIFTLCTLTVLYVYLGFPLCLVALTFWKKRRDWPEQSDDELPLVTMAIAAHNEELVIEDKIANCRKLAYPAGKLQVIFVSDSTDRTNELLEQNQDGLIEVVLLKERRGKLSALKGIFPLCRGEILVLSDANTYYFPDAIRKLVRHFQDPRVGLVTGDVRILPSDQKFGLGERLYYQYERWLQVLESRFWSTVAIDGAMYALRMSSLRVPVSRRVPDDLVMGMNVGLQGLRMIYDAEAIAEENPTPLDTQEFARKVRSIAASIQSVLDKEGVPSLAQTRLWWVYVSHKLLRWLVPLFLIAAFLASLAAAVLGGDALWIGISAAQAIFYLLAFAGWRVPGAARSLIVKVPYYFAMVNCAALLGIVRGLRFEQGEMWTRTERIKVKTP
jgi:poly-beta-1,6-N-acetyl-D-glucosamine synthase